MKKEFKIIEEATLDLGRTYELYLMLIKDGEDYLIEIDSRLSQVGMRYVRSRREGTTVFQQMETRLRCYRDLYAVIHMLQLAFAMKTIREHMFIVNNLNKEVEFNDIWKLKHTYSCETSPVLTDLIFEDNTYNRSIYITFPNRKEPLGYFKAQNQNEDSAFVFHLNEKFQFPK